jgi:hypothetical protein
MPHNASMAGLATNAGRTALASLTLVLALIAPGTAGAHERGALWTVRQAESISTVRSMPVHVLECTGRGRGVRQGGVTRYRHFACTGGTRAPWETYDTIAVLYIVHPISSFARRDRQRYTLSNVRFVGGPGIP